jgi:RNA polymerase sigma factor (sigma-70 family)
LPPPGRAKFEALYAAYHDTILAYCARRLPRSDAMDAAAEVFVVAWRRIDDVPEPDRERAWLYGVAYRVVANQWRSRDRRLRLSRRAVGVLTEDDGPEHQVVRNEEERVVLAALRRLRPADGELLRLSLWDEMSPAEIAAMLDASNPAIRQRLSRARRRLAAEYRRTERRERRRRAVYGEGGGHA